MDWVIFINQNSPSDTSIIKNETNSLKRLCKSINIMCLKCFPPVFKLISLLCSCILSLKKNQKQRFVFLTKSALKKYWGLPNIPRGFKLMLLNRLFQVNSKQKSHVLSSVDAWNLILPDVNSKQVHPANDTEISEENDSADYSLQAARMFFEKYNCQRELSRLNKCI